MIKSLFKLLVINLCLFLLLTGVVVASVNIKATVTEANEYYTDVGTNVKIDFNDNESITFNEVNTSGITTIEEATTPPADPAGFNFLGTYYDISTTAVYTAPITISLSYDDTDLTQDEENKLQILHYDEINEKWEKCQIVQGGRDTVNNIITVEVDHLSWHAIGYDISAPLTDMILSGNIGNNNWYISDVAVSFDVIDNLSSQEEILTEYSFDSINWNTYSQPFTISSEGETTIYFFSTDNSDNTEDTKTETIKIDKTSPAIEATIPTAEYIVNEYFDVCISANDGTGSGINSIEAFINDNQYDFVPGISQTILLSHQGTNPYGMKLGDNTFEIIATDNAGNSTTNTYTFHLTYDIRWRPPIKYLNESATEVYTMTDDSSLPIKWIMYDNNGIIVTDPTVKAQVYDSLNTSNSRFFIQGIGDDHIRLDPDLGQYIVNVHTGVNYETLSFAVGGTYNIELWGGAESCVLKGTLLEPTQFTLIDKGKAKGKQ